MERQTPPPPPVTISHPVQKNVTEYLEFTGTTEAAANVDIRARVQGFLDQILFQEGMMVKKDQVLFIIDQRTYQAAVDKAQAELTAAIAQHADADADFARYDQLFTNGVVSEAEYTQVRTKRDAAREAENAARAQLIDAELQLSYTEIRTPMAGRVGRSLVDLGNLVGQSEPTLLTVVIDYDPIYAYFSISELDLLRLRESAPRQEGATTATLNRVIPVEMGLMNQEGYPFQGKVDFVDPGVDPKTGTLLVRAVFDNPKIDLLPGLFARLRIPMKEREGALLVPDRVVGSDQAGKYVLVVNKEKTVERRAVETGPVVEGMRVILEGLKPDDMVIVNGIQRARPGAPVTPQTEDEAAAASEKPADAPSGK